MKLLCYFTLFSEESSDEEGEPNETSAHFANKIYTHTLRSQRSLRLLVADNIKHGLDEVDDEEEKLEEQGHSVEEKLRTANSEYMSRGHGPTDPCFTRWSSHNSP